MRFPKRPPSRIELLRQVAPERLMQILSTVTEPTVSGKYVHWDDLRHREPPSGITLAEWWLGLTLHRTPDKIIALTDSKGQPFSFRVIEWIQEKLHRIDLLTGGGIQMREQVTNPETKRRYLVRSLMDEAITSSQLEGAVTTREVAKEMIRTGRRPRDRSERMILNNYETMQRIGEIREQPLSRDLVFELHRRVTDETLDDPTAAGRFRGDDEYRVVGDHLGEVFHNPPPADQLDARMAAMCEFANASGHKGFIHPVIRSIILHFWLAYDHPFVDGNGRTARALFYWSMLHHGYWLFEYVSISQVILRGPVRYGEAFLHTETDSNDLTYFIIYNLDVISRSIDALYHYIENRGKELGELEHQLRGIAELNHRQRELIRHALGRPGFSYTVASHRASHGVVLMTARTDLQDLERRGLLSKKKSGKAWVFTPVHDLESKLRERS
jgi:Fic family protein